MGQGKCGTPKVPGMESYSVKRLIGKGSYGEVFLVAARDGKKKVGIDSSKGVWRGVALMA